MQSVSARQRRATIPLSNKSFDAISLGNATSRSATRGCGVGEVAACLLLLPTPPARRGSFLYRSSDSESDMSPMSLSRKLSATSDTQKLVEETLVTPFAQILQSLKTVRDNYLAITELPVDCLRRQVACTQTDHVTLSMSTATDNIPYGASSFVPMNDAPGEQQRRLALDTLEELEWCMDQLESMQTHRSVANMAANKFKRMLSRELNQFCDSSRSGNEISEYIYNTFLDVPNTELQLPLLNIEDADEEFASSGSRSSRRPSRQTVPDSSLLVDGSATSIDKCVVQSTEDISEKAARALEQLEPEITDVQLVECMEVLHTWGPDIFHLAEVTSNRPLTPVVYTIMKEIDATRLLKITPQTMVTYLTLLEHHYRADNTYHNSIHAADVTQSASVLLGVGALQNVFTDIEILATLFSTAIHDVDHPGVTSQYLINSGMELALMYNDQSVLENHHLAVAFKLLQEENADIFQNMSAKSYKILRRLVIDIVLATDMTKHMTLLADLKTLVETKRIAGSSVLKLEQYADRIQILKTLVHCADLSNPTKPLYLYRQWADRVMEEFFRQGDLEREQGLDVSPMCDRMEPTIEQTQVSFIDYVVHPLWEAWCELVYPECQGILDTLESNRDWYASHLPVVRRQPTADTVVEESERTQQDADVDRGPP